MIRPQLLLEALATGAWATGARLRVYPALLVAAYGFAGVLLVLTGSGNADLTGRLIGADFGMLWSAGQSALGGRPEDVFPLAAQAAVQERLFGPEAGFTPWLYPPTFLLIATPLAALPYLAALALWQGATFALYLLAIRACTASRPQLAGHVLLMTAAFPAAFINAAHGQNGFLTAALLTSGVLLLRPRPLLAGVLFGLVSYKPQFCVLIPVLLVCEGAWPALASAFLTGCVLVATTAALFGAGVFRAFIDSLPDTQRLTLETGASGWEKVQSVFAGVRLMGGDYALAMSAQIIVTTLVIAALVFVWRSDAGVRLRQALFLTGVLLTTPYCMDYDMTLLAPALVLLGLHGMERGFARWEISLMALAFTTPLLARVFGATTHAPLGAFALLALFTWTMRRALADAREIRTSPAPPLPSAS